MSDTKKYFQRIGKISELAGLVKSAMVDSQIGADGRSIADQRELVGSVTQASMGSPLFEGIDNPEVVKSISTAWGSAIRAHCDTFGEMPRDELLASAVESMQSVMLASAADNHGSRFLFESLGGEAMETSAGVELRARTSALILPVALSAATNDAATFVNGGQDEVEFFEIQRQAGTAFGDLAKSEVIDEFFAGQYSSMKQMYQLATQADGTKTRFVVYVYNNAAPTADETALISVVANQNPQAIGYKGKSVRLYANGKLVATDIDNAKLFGTVTVDGVDYTISPDGANDPALGRIAFITSAAIPADKVTFSVQYDIDIENFANVLPEVQHSMVSYKLNPHQSVIAAQHTIQSYWALNRQFGIDMRSLQAGTQRNLLAYEKDMRNLRDMLNATLANPTTSIPLQVSAGDDWKNVYERMMEPLSLLSHTMLMDTKTTGLVGLFARTGATAMIKALGAPYFVPAPNYRQVPRIHFVGTLFGIYKIYEVPFDMAVNGATLTEYDAVAYGRGADFSQAGLVAGDAIPATMYRHNVSSKLFNRDTLWSLDFGDISPRNGYSYFRKVTFVK